MTPRSEEMLRMTPALRLDHLLAEDARAQERSGEANGDVRVPDGEREILQARPLLRLARWIGFHFGVVGGVVDEDVDAPELRKNRVARLEQRGLAGNVGGKAEALGTMRDLELIGAQARIGSSQVEQDDMSACIRENGAVVIPKQPGAAGNDGHAASKVKKFADAAVRGS